MVNSDSSLPSELQQKSDNFLHFVRLSIEDMLKIINNLAAYKAHVGNEIIIKMFKSCGSSVCRLLNIIYKSCLDRGKFRLEWKKAYVVPIHKKMIKSWQKIIVLPPCYLYLVKFLNVCSTILALIS